jgi:symplekin
MDIIIREFALQMLRKLKYKAANGHAKSPQKEQEAEVDVAMEDVSIPKENGIHVEEEQKQLEEQRLVTVDGETPSEVDQEKAKESSQPLEEEELVQTPYLPERIELPAQKAQVLQHVELLFALSVKNPEFLEE